MSICNKCSEESICPTPCWAKIEEDSNKQNEQFDKEKEIVL